MATRWLALGIVRPNSSVMSNSVGNMSFGSFQSKQCTIYATSKRSTVRPNYNPGQPLLPDPNGINWKSRSWTSMLLPSNLSGQNFSGGRIMEISRVFIKLNKVVSETGLKGEASCLSLRKILLFYCLLAQNRKL